MKERGIFGNDMSEVAMQYHELLIHGSVVFWRS